MFFIIINVIIVMNIGFLPMFMRHLNMQFRFNTSNPASSTLINVHGWTMIDSTSQTFDLLKKDGLTYSAAKQHSCATFYPAFSSFQFTNYENNINWSSIFTSIPVNGSFFDESNSILTANYPDNDLQYYVMKNNEMRDDIFRGYR